ncbi:GNAT family N-acetyltransferase [Photobacterium damselae]|nr:GNAT family N-acetyltransferase [Photobacterium damselae]
MTFKNINDIRRLLQKAPDNNVNGDHIIASGTIVDNKSTTHDFQVLCGWSDSIARQCDLNWGAFHYSVLKNIETQAAGDNEQFVKLIQQFSLEDAHWQWETKHQYMFSSQYNWFYLMIDGKPEAACLIYHPKVGTLTKEPIFYIEYLAVAPWNRINPVCDQVYKGLGTILLKEVILYAENKLTLCDGFSLHSLSKAEGFYAKIGMKSIDSQAKQGMTYFEMEKSNLSQFMGVQQ